MPGLSDDQRIREYKRLIRRMPAENQFLLLYVLDLLGIFAKESDKNLMTAASELIRLFPANWSQIWLSFSSRASCTTVATTCGRRKVPSRRTSSSS